MTVRTGDEAVRSGIAWLAGAQESDGAFPSFAAALDGAPQWEPDRLNFVTALTSLALEGVEVDGVPEMRDRAAAYLVGEREAAALWRYWSRESPLHDYTPPDADDTACCTLAVGADSGASNRSLLLANRDPNGRFYTWLLWRPEVRSVRYRWAVRSERTVAVRERRAELWANSEASPDDVDATVNANVIRYLGPAQAPIEAIEWVAAVIESGTEIEADHWYRSRTSLYRSVAVAASDGVARFAGLRDTILGRILDDPGPAGLRNDLELADAVQVLRRFAAPSADVHRLATELVDRQRADGSWGRSICYFGGPQESFGWASEALATATAVGALHGLDLGP